MSEMIYAGNMPVLALRGLAIFPDQTVHFDVGRTKSVYALEAAMKENQSIFLVPQKDFMVDDPNLSDLYPIGTIAQVKQVLKAQDENLRVLVTGLSRGRITEVKQTSPYLMGMVESVSSGESTDSLKSQAMRREANSLYATYTEITEHPSQMIQMKMFTSNDNGFLADSIGQNSGLDIDDKAALLCQLNPNKRLEMAISMLRQEIEVLKLESEIHDRTRTNMDQNQRDYYLREQIKAIREELGEGDEDAELDEDLARIKALHLPEEQEKKLVKDAEKLKKQPFGSSEAQLKTTEMAKKGYEEDAAKGVKNYRHRAIVWACPAHYYTNFTYWADHCWGVKTLVDMECMLSYHMYHIGDEEQAMIDMASSYERMMMRSHTNGGYVNSLDELWKMVKKFNADMVIMYDHVSCKNVGCLHGLYEDQAREHGVHMVWVPHDLMDPRTVSRVAMRDAFNKYMTNVFREEPLDPTFVDYEDPLTW